MAQLFQVWKSTCTFVVDNQTFISCITDLDWFWMWIHVLFSKKNVDKRTDGRMNRHTDIRTDGQLETDGRTNRHHQSISKNCVTIQPKRHTKWIIVRTIHVYFGINSTSIHTSIYFYAYWYLVHITKMNN